MSWHNSVVEPLNLGMKEEKDQEQPLKTPVKASEVTSAMIQNAHASGDGSIKRSEEESIGDDMKKGLRNKNVDDEGIV